MREAAQDEEEGGRDRGHGRGAQPSLGGLLVRSVSLGIVQLAVALSGRLADEVATTASSGKMGKIRAVQWRATLSMRTSIIPCRA